MTFALSALTASTEINILYIKKTLLSDKRKQLYVPLLTFMLPIVKSSFRY